MVVERSSIYFSSFRRKVPHCCAKKRRTLQCLLIVIAICAIMNAATIVSIGYHISVRQETLIDIFNNSMHLYASTASHKYAIDEIQFIFQCCGHSSYADWFLFDWQVNPPFKKGNSKHGIASVNKKYIQTIFKMRCDIRNVNSLIRVWIMPRERKWQFTVRYPTKNIGIKVFRLAAAIYMQCHRASTRKYRKTISEL